MDIEYDRYLEKDAPTQATDFPKMHKSSEFQEKIKYSFLALPYKSINSDYVNFFKGAKQALDMMRYTKITKMHGHIITKSGSEHDPPSVAETINKSIDIAPKIYAITNIIQSIINPLFLLLKWCMRHSNADRIYTYFSYTILKSIEV